MTVAYTVELAYSRHVEVIHGKAASSPIAVAAIQRTCREYISQFTIGPATTYQDIAQKVLGEYADRQPLIKAMLFGGETWEAVPINYTCLLEDAAAVNIEAELIFRMTHDLAARMEIAYQALDEHVREKYEFVDGNAYNAAIVSLLRETPDPTVDELRKFLAAFVTQQ